MAMPLAFGLGDGTTYVINASFYDVTTSLWSDPVTISGSNAYNPQIAVNQDGSAIAVWCRSDDSIPYSKVEYAVFEYGLWSAAAPIDTTNPDDSQELLPQVGVDNQGGAVAVWQAGGSPGNVVRAGTYDFDSDTWFTQDISACEGNTRQHAALAVNNSGAAFVVWELLDLNNNAFGIESNHLIDGDWYEVDTVTTSSILQEIFPRIAVDPVGNAQAIWTEWNPSTYAFTINSSRRSITYDSWDGAQVISDFGNFNETRIPFADIGVDNSGEAIAIWSLFDEANNGGIVQTRSFRQGQWSDDTINLSEPCYQSALSRIVVNSSGDAYAIWATGNPQDAPIVQVSRYDQDTDSWTLHQTISDETTGAYFPVITTNDYGDVFTVWYASDDLEEGVVQSSNFSNPVAVLPPDWIDGSQYLEDYVVDQNLINYIEWGTSDDSSVVAYQIYRDGILIAIVSSDVQEYVDNYRTAGESNTYDVYAMSIVGLLSAPVTITLP